MAGVGSAGRRLNRECASPERVWSDDPVGDAAAAAKRRASEAVVQQGFDAAKGVAGEILENVARQVRKVSAGQTDDGPDIGQRVRRVAESVRSRPRF